MTELTGENVRRIGQLLFGHSWRAGFEDRFSISPRKLQRVIAGRETITGDMAKDIEIAIRDHGQKLDDILELFV